MLQTTEPNRRTGDARDRQHGVRSLLQNLSRWLPVGIWMGVVFGLSAQPDLPSLPGLSSLDWGDKISHAVMYAIGGALIWRAIRQGVSRPWQVVWVVLLATIYGLSDEFHQRYVPNRTFDLLDLAADAVGAAFAAVLLTLTMGGGSKVGTRTRGREDLRSEGQETL